MNYRQHLLSNIIRKIKKDSSKVKYKNINDSLE